MNRAIGRGIFKEKDIIVFITKKKAIYINKTKGLIAWTA